MFFLPTVLTYSQVNLVRNGSFENNSACPTTEDQLQLCDFWLKANLSTVDYVNSCAVNNLGGIKAPNYWMGYQEPYHGTAYCGIGVYADDSFIGIDYLVSEYIQTELTDSLKAMHQYQFTMYISLANHAEFTINNFGAYISAQRPYDMTTFGIFNFTPQVVVSYLTDTLNWVKVTQTFMATGDEKWLTIGRFDYNGQSQLMTVTPDTTPFAPTRYAYYLVDSVSLIDITNPENLPDLQNVISPNNDGSNDFLILPEYDFLFEEELKIYSRWGNLVAVLSNANNKWYGHHQNGNEAPEGVYYYIFTAKTEEGKIISKKGFVQLFR